MNTRALLVFFLVELFSVAHSQTPAYTLTATTKIACVGDSLTTGFPLSASQSYPSVLGGLLGPGYQVQNDGYFGATLSSTGTPSYWGSPPFTASQSFLPNIVVICLGTNDLQTGNWPGSAHFLSDLNTLITLYQGLPSHPTVYVCLPPWIQGNFNGATDALLAGTEIPLILQAVQTNGACVIDLHSIMTGQPGLYSDQVHLNASGYTLMANQVNCTLRRTCHCGPITPTFTPGTSAVGTPIAYPNPSTTGSPISVLINLGQPAPDLTLSVFTASFRKVNEQGYTDLPSGGLVLSIPPTDKEGNPLANGFYYLVVKTPQGHSLGKWLLLR